MRSSFAVRRQARKVGQEEEEEIEDARPGNGDQDHGKKSISKLSAHFSNVFVR